MLLPKIKKFPKIPMDGWLSQHQLDFLLSRVSILTRDIDIANLSVCPSVRYVSVSDENGLTYRHRFFHRTVTHSF